MILSMNLIHQNKDITTIKPKKEYALIEMLCLQKEITIIILILHRT